VQHRERADIASKVSWVGAQRSERFEGRAEQYPNELLLMPSNQRSQLRRHREHHVEVRHRQELVLLPLHPVSRAFAAPSASAVVARVQDQMSLSALGALHQVRTDRGRATAHDVPHGTGVARQQGCAEALLVPRPVLTDDVSQRRHRQRLQALK
jgi:hypothetical protein